MKVIDQYNYIDEDLTRDQAIKAMFNGYVRRAKSIFGWFAFILSVICIIIFVCAFAGAIVVHFFNTLP